MQHGLVYRASITRHDPDWSERGLDSSLLKRETTMKRTLLIVAIPTVALLVTSVFYAPHPVAVRHEAPRPNHKASRAVIEHATAETFENQVLRSPVQVLVDFYADWCRPCQIQDVILKEFAAEFDGGKVIKVNVDESPELAARYDVQGLPTLLIFQDGKVFTRQVGLATKQQLKAALES